MKFSIKLKFTLFTSVLILTIGVGSGAYFAMQAKKMLEDELEKLGYSFVSQLATDEDVRNAIYLEQPAFLDTPINRLRELDVEEELAYCRVLLHSGAVFREEKEDWVKINVDDVTDIDSLAKVKIAQSNRFIVKARQDETDQVVVRTKTERRKRLKETFYDFLAPVFDKKEITEEEFVKLLDIGGGLDVKSKVLGYVQIGLSSSKVNKRLWKILLTGVIPLSLTTILGGFWVLNSIARKIVKPIVKLVNMSARVAKGDLDYEVDVKSNDEIGVLAASFNEMTKQLKMQMYAKEHVMAELKKLNIELENSNVDLTKANEQLKEAQDQVIRSEKLAVIGQLASSVAHELRSPIGAIKNSIFFLKRKIHRDSSENSKNLERLLDIVEKETERSSKIISDLLGFTQTSKLAVAPTKIRHVIDEALLRISAPDSIKITVDVNPDLPEVLVDSAQIGQVFLNIIQNSYHAMPNGGRLTITANHKDEFLEVRFEDTGCGISKGFIGKVFEPLFTTKADGIGLGMAFSYGVIQKHGGSIEVKSDDGKGAVFTVKLKIKD